MTPLERAARAIRDEIAFEQDEDDGISFMVEGGYRGEKFFEEIARAVVKAIREPSGAMIAAGDATDQMAGIDGPHADTPPALVWPAMINALLKEGA